MVGSGVRLLSVGSSVMPGPICRGWPATMGKVGSAVGAGVGSLLSWARLRRWSSSWRATRPAAAFIFCPSLFLLLLAARFPTVG